MAKLDSTFESIRAPEKRKLLLMQSKLQGYAFTYFQAEQSLHPEMTFQEFRGKLRDRYFPRALRTARETGVRETEFEDLPIDEIIRRLRENLAEVLGAAPT